MLEETRAVHRVLERWAAGVLGRPIEEPLTAPQSTVVSKAVAQLPPRVRLALEERYLRTAGTETMAGRVGLSRQVFTAYLATARQRIAEAVLWPTMRESSE